MATAALAKRAAELVVLAAALEADRLDDLEAALLAASDAVHGDFATAGAEVPAFGYVEHAGALLYKGGDLRISTRPHAFLVFICNADPVNRFFRPPPSFAPPCD